MQDIYYDVVSRNGIDLSNDVRSWDDWRKGQSGLCCRHPDNFLIFVPYSQLEVQDEYADGDPYTVTKNINSPFHQRRFNTTISLIQKNVKRDAGLKILDLGCGEGHLTNEIKARFPKAEIHGLDYSLSAIRYANETFNDIEFVVADAYKPPYKESYFDVVILNNIWEHVPDPLTLLKAVSVILKRDGLVIISTPSRYRFSNLLRVITGRRITFMSNHHVTEYTVGQVSEQLRYGGYTVKEINSPAIREHRLAIHLLKLVSGTLLKVFRSHHILESTVFYVARKD